MMKNFEISVKRFDEFAAEYAERFMDVDSYSDSIEKFCTQINIKQPKILELGCGPGNITRLLQVRLPEARITAIDLAPKMIEIARKQLPGIDFRVMDVRDISSIPDKFDAVMCSFCLPFLSKEDADKLIADCAEKLSSVGVLYISTMEGNETKAGFEATSFSGNSEIYFNYHSRPNLENSFAECGFEIRHLKLQDYLETDGRITTDIILIGIKA